MEGKDKTSCRIQKRRPPETLDRQKHGAKTGRKTAVTNKDPGCTTKEYLAQMHAADKRSGRANKRTV